MYSKKKSVNATKDKSNYTVRPYCRKIKLRSALGPGVAHNDLILNKRYIFSLVVSFVPLIYNLEIGLSLIAREWGKHTRELANAVTY